MSKTFEEELAGRLWDILYPNHDRTGVGDVVKYENRIHDLIQVFKGVHQAEMDRVIKKVLGKRDCPPDCGHPYDRQPYSHSTKCDSRYTLLLKQRARYKAIKDA